MAEELAFDEQVIDRLAAVLKALADPNRLRILAVLVQHEACNCQLNNQLGLVSRVQALTDWDFCLELGTST